ncbi:histidine kinase [uncultured Dokdonia sp.]|uniref:tetratricopeptide repeat-containing sensor histidine kinase n=1 Tax=uncultured Dokdonia sp. TaxID=575653 RepID=UPI00261E3275|nr:histidine kinase [uncultured Dokdonia sp.]
MIRNTSLYCILLSCFLFACSTDQKSTNKSIEDTVKLFQKKAFENVSDSSLIYLKDAANLIKSTPTLSDSLQAENDYLTGSYYSQIGEIDSAATYFHKTIDRIKDSIKNDREVAYFYNSWVTYKKLQEYGDCIAVAHKFESLLPINNNVYRAFAFYQLENTYIEIKDYKKALSYSDKRIETLQKQKDTLSLISAVSSKTKIEYKYLNNKEKAYQTLENILQKEEQLNDIFKQELFINYGYYNHLDKNYRVALKYYLKASHIAKKISESPTKIENLAKTYANLGEVYLDLKIYDSSKYYLDQATTLKTLNISKTTISNISNYKLRYAYETKSNINEVLKYLDTITKYQNTRYEEKYSKDLKSLEFAYKEEKRLRNEKQEAIIEKLRTQTQLLLVFIMAILLISIGIFFYKKRQRTFDEMSLQMQQRLLRSQMNPHFTFNTLYAIQNTIKKDQQGAINYLLKFSRLLRLILENSTNNYVLLEKELESLRKYMDLQLLRFPDKFEYEIHLIDLEEDDLIFIPPMLLQPYIENSIEHAFKGIEYKGKISITLSEKEEYLQCIIEDNGVGIQSKMNSHKESVSTTLISDFIEKATKQKISVLNKGDRDTSTSGVITSFLIPYKQTEHD